MALAVQKAVLDQVKAAEEVHQVIPDQVATGRVQPEMYLVEIVVTHLQRAANSQVNDKTDEGADFFSLFLMR